ncbi:MAG: outer membrane protein assembly factor BamE, partial [Methyloligellaceae bacterium]
VVAVYFDDTGTVQNVANYGLKDGKVFNYISRETPSYANDDGLIKQLFRNIGSKPNLGGQ